MHGRVAGWMVVALAALAGPAVAAEDARIVEATGEAAVVDGNVPLARDRAIDDALRRAVEQTCGTMVVSHSKAEGFQLVEDRILTRARGYVSKYDVLSTRQEKGVVTVTVKATVGTSRLADDLEAIGLTIARKGMPRIAVMIAEQRIGEVKPAAWWGAQGDKKAPAAGALVVDQRIAETALIGEWTKAGFSFVDPEALANGAQVAGVVNVELGREQIRKIGDLSQADVLLVGRIVSTKSQNAKDLLDGISHGADKVTGVSCSATLTVRAFNADTGEVLAASEATDAAMNQSELACGRDAMKRATVVLSRDLQTSLVSAWNRQLQNGGRVQLKVTGLDSFKTLSAFKSALGSSVRGVKSVGNARYDKGAADLDLQVEGSAEELATQLESKKILGRKIEIVSLSQNRIEVKLLKK